MQYRRLGGSGCRVSAISLGSWLTFGDGVDQKATTACVRAALDCGINLFDTADVYALGRAEEALGQSLADVRRQDVVIATKTYFPMSKNVNDQGLSRKRITEACDASLRRLRTDYIDLYQCHRRDVETPIEETVCAMEDLIRRGKILYWGVSNWGSAQLIEACEIADRRNAYRPVTNQPRYNLLDRALEFEVLPVCLQHGIGQIVYSPLAQGLLTGKYRGGAVPKGSRAADEGRNVFLKPQMTAEAVALADRIAELARSNDLLPAQLALAAVLAQGGVASAIVGATTPQQVIENAKAGDVTLPDSVLATLDEWTRPT